MMHNHKQLSDDSWFAGAVWTGNGYMPHVRFSLDTMLPAFRMAEKHGVKNVFLTMWGDGGGECSRFALLSALFHLSEVAKGNTDEAEIKRKFREAFRANYDDFLLLDLDLLDGAPFFPILREMLLVFPSLKRRSLTAAPRPQRIFPEERLRS